VEELLPDVEYTWGLMLLGRQMHTAEPSALEVELVIEKLKSRKSPGIDQVRAELRQCVEQCTKRCINISIWKKEELPEEWKESIVVPIYKKGDKTL
jgi:hypothetical protein